MVGIYTITKKKETPNQKARSLSKIVSSNGQQKVKQASFVFTSAQNKGKQNAHQLVLVASLLAQVFLTLSPFSCLSLSLFTFQEPSFFVQIQRMICFVGSRHFINKIV
jgi:hypothetical protein